MNNNNFIDEIFMFHILESGHWIEVFEPEYFNTKPIQELYKVLKKYVLEYGELPSLTQALDLVHLADKRDVLPDDIVTEVYKQYPKVKEYSEEWLDNSVKGLLQWQNVMYTMRNTLTHTKLIQSEVTFDNVEKYRNEIIDMFNDGVNIQTKQSETHLFFDMAEHAIEEDTTWTTGYNFFDLCLNGGWTKKTLNILMGAPKSGKSKWLCNLAANSVKNGDNTAYVTLELSYKLVMQRIGSNLFKIPMKDYRVLSRDLEYMNNKARAFRNSNLKEAGELVVKEFGTSSLSVRELEKQLLATERELSHKGEKFKFKNIIIDYVNIMKDSKNPNSDSTYMKIKSICEDLRAMAQRNDWCIISATQSNRSGYDSTDLGMSSVSESSGLVATCDSLFGIIQNPIMRAQGVYYLKAVAMRNSEHMGDKKKFKEVRDYLEILEDPTENIISEGFEVPKEWDALQQPVMNQPVMNQPAPKPEIKKDLNQVKQEIASLNNKNLQELFQ